jgi:glutathione-specific gamma-glutamylcyclotransferase
MWVFSYGSLMWDSWETDRGCLRRVTGELRGYSRSFNKLSVRNWGTRLYPALIASDSSCQGIAFEFPEARRAEIVTYLIHREGKDFTLDEQPIVLAAGAMVAAALVPFYHGPNIIPLTGAPGLAAMALRAKGVSGSGADYIKGIANHLRQLGIDDPAVADLCSALEKVTSAGPPV